MVFAIIFGILSCVVGALFWIFIGFAINKAVKKTAPYKPYLIKAVIFGVAWCAAICLTVVFAANSILSGEAAEIAETTVETAKSGWNKSLVRKINRLDIQFASMRQIPRPGEEGYNKNDFDIFQAFDFNDSSKKIFEIELLINNAAPESKKIAYRKMIKQKIVYALDKDDVYMTAYIIDDSGVAAIPPILLYFVPSYRAQQASQYIPMGKSKLRLRVDAKDAADIKKIFVGENSIDVIVPPELLKSQSNEIEVKKEI